MEWLAEDLSDPSVVVADCRFELAQPRAGALHYRQEYIPGAIYLDLEADLSGRSGRTAGATRCPPSQRSAEKWAKEQAPPSMDHSE